MYPSVAFTCPRCSQKVIVHIWSSYTEHCAKHICPGGTDRRRIFDRQICAKCDRRLDCLTTVEPVLEVSGHAETLYEVLLTFYGGVEHDITNPLNVTLCAKGARTSAASFNGKFVFRYPTFKECEDAATTLRDTFKTLGFRTGLRRGFNKNKGPKKSSTDYYVWADKFT